MTHGAPCVKRASRPNVCVRGSLPALKPITDRTGTADRTGNAAASEDAPTTGASSDAVKAWRTRSTRLDHDYIRLLSEVIKPPPRG